VQLYINGDDEPHEICKRLNNHCVLNVMERFFQIKKKNLLKFLEFVFARKQTNVANQKRVFSASSFKHHEVKR
jgi:hypothetical protein